MDEEKSKTNVSSRSDLGSFAGAEEEMENWTFVNQEDAPACHELSDDCSEHESDSGSSIVVIDSQSAQPSNSQEEQQDCMRLLEIEPSPVANLEELLAGADSCTTVSDDQCTVTEEPVTLTSSVDETVRFFTQQDEFVKEQSPYEVVEQPPSSLDEDNGNQEQPLPELENPAADSPQIEDKCGDGLPSISNDLEEEPLSLVPEGPSGAESEIEPAQALLQNSEEVSQESVEALQDRCLDLEGQVVSENDPADVGTFMKSDDAETGDVAPVDAEEEWSTDSSSTSDEESDDELDEEAWDLSLGGLANSSSLASSVSSLPQQQASPVPEPSIRITKPDLLEEAKRIEELDQMDLSTLTNVDLPPELNVANIFRDRHYVHHPNQRLNMTLTYVMAFALAAAVGFALGNIVGLSDNFPSRCRKTGGDIFQGKMHGYEGWSDEDWLSEIRRLMAANEEMSQALNKDHYQSAADPSTCRVDPQMNELKTENWDLKQSIGRIRYGKPVRSLEDLDMINRLQTENQDLRATVGKLRYQCGQPLSPSGDASTPAEPKVLSSSGPLLNKTLDSMNLTVYWASLVGVDNDDEALDDFKESAADLIRLIGLRREELDNRTKEAQSYTKTSRIAEKMQATLKKSVQKVVDLVERVHNHEEAALALAQDVESDLKELRLKVENRWAKMLQLESEELNDNPVKTADGSYSESYKDESGTTKSINSDWFISMGQEREKLRRKDQESHWLFERAKNREEERRSRKFAGPARINKRDKMYRGNAWGHFSA